MKTKIFIIAGKAGTGKNEVAKILKEIYQENNNQCGLCFIFERVC